MDLLIGIAQAFSVNPGDIPGTGLVENGEIDWEYIVFGGIRLILSLIALGAFFSIVYSGFMIMSAGGDADKATKAKKNIVWAIIGIIVAIFSLSIVSFFGNFSDSIEDLVSDSESEDSRSGDGPKQ